VADQAWFRVLWTQRLTHESVVEEVYLPYREVVGRSPVRIQTLEFRVSGIIGSKAREWEGQ
jgi:hypothetical protein